MKKTKWLIGTATAIAIAQAGAAWSHDPSQHAPAVKPVTTPGARLALADTVLTDQNGRQLRLLSDVVADKVVVVSFVYTSCDATCPVASQTFSQLQDQLGSLLDQKVRLISLTVDPARDTPEKLKTVAAQHGARPGWLWLTGPSANVTEALKGFGAYSANHENHPMTMLVGDGSSGRWTRVYDIDDVQRLFAKTGEYLATKGAHRLAASGKP